MKMRNGAKRKVSGRVSGISTATVCIYISSMKMHGFSANEGMSPTAVLIYATAA